MRRIRWSIVLLEPMMTNHTILHKRNTKRQLGGEREGGREGGGRGSSGSGKTRVFLIEALN